MDKDSKNILREKLELLYQLWFAKTHHGIDSGNLTIKDSIWIIRAAYTQAISELIY